MRLFDLTTYKPTARQPGRVMAVLNHPRVKATAQTLMLVAFAVAGTAITDHFPAA